VITQKEFWNKCYGIGLDKNSKKLFYAKKTKNGIQESIIDLSMVEKCRMVKTSEKVKDQSGETRLCDLLELVFTFSDQVLPEKVLEFYSSSNFMPNEEVISLAEKWLAIVNSDLNTGKK
jgi:hypothetical protein